MPTNKQSRKTRPLPISIVLLQVVIGLALAGVFLIVGVGQAFSSLLATVVVVIPNALFVRAVLSLKAVAAGVAWRRILLQQGWKATFTVMLMVGVFVLFQPQPLGFFTALIALQLAYVLAPLLFGLKR